MSEYETHQINWNDISITIEFNKSYSPAFKEIQGFNMTHMKIQRQTPGQLPISSTGFTSRFIGQPQVEEYGDIKGYVTAWLDNDAQSKEWKKYVIDSAQLKLF